MIVFILEACNYIAIWIPSVYVAYIDRDEQHPVESMAQIDRIQNSGLYQPLF